jgi:glycosyltransferase involved in cell wall biosynthesis
VVASVLQVITDTDRRGAQVFANDLHDAMAGLGTPVRTVALAPGTAGGLDVPVLGDRRLGRRTLVALRRELQAATVAIAHGSSTLPACALASAGTGTPFVYRQISDSRFWAPTGVRRVRVQWGLSRAAGVVALWTGSADTLVQHFRVPRRKIHVIPNGVPAEHFQPASRAARRYGQSRFGLDPERPTVLAIGALVPEKGVDLVIEAIGQTPAAQLLVVGDGPEREHLERRALRVAPGRVVFAGPVDDPAAAYAVADVVVLPSRGGDSMPAVLIEAGLMGIAVISTPVEGIPEIVVDGVTGELVPVGSLPALVDAVSRLTADSVLGARLGQAAREHCLQHFGIEGLAEQWLAALARVSPRSDG